MLFEIRSQILFIIGILVLFDSRYTDGSQDKANKLIRNICQKLSDEDLSLEENQRWEYLCEKWMHSIDHHHYDEGIEDLVDRSHKVQIHHQPRRIGSRSSSRSSSRVSSRISRTSSSSMSRYRNTRTGTSISRPTGWLWSRSRHVFLPVSRYYYYRSYSSSNRYTTPPTSSNTYYYCSPSSNVSLEIQCNTINGDNQCCEEETSHQVYCCGGAIDNDYAEDFNRTTKILAQIFYTLTILALFMRRFF